MSTAAALFARFWAKVDKTETCWLWTGAINSSGYAVLGVNGRLVYAHRYAHERFTGPIPDGFQVDHLCNVRHCVAPTHLEAVTPTENARRRSERQTHCIRGHERAGNTYKGGQCKPCYAARHAERYIDTKQVAA